MGACLSKGGPPPAASGTAALQAPPPPANSEPPSALAPSCAAAPSCAGPSGAAALQAPREEERLQAVHALDLIGVEPKPAFDHITQLMAAMFETPVSSVSLVAEELHFISRAGNWACSANRAGSFCDWILVPQAPEMLIVENALEDARFRSHPYVVGAPGIRFYAGAPLVATKDGHRYGTLCVFDFRPRSFSPAQYAMLSHFAELTVREMERELLVLEQQRQTQAPPPGVHLTRALDTFHEGVILLDLSSTSWHMVYANQAFREAAHMPALLSSASGAGADRPPLPGQASGDSVDFWQLFRLVTADDQDCNHAALLAMATGKEFTIQVQPVASSYSREVSGYSGGGSHGSSSGKNGSKGGGQNGGPAPPVLTMLFRPAGVEPLRQAQPQIGIPAWVGSSSGSSAGSSCSSSSRGGSGLCSREDSGSVPLSSRVSKEAKAQPYYFGVLQASSEQAAPQGSMSQSSTPALPTPVGTGDKAASIRSAGNQLPASDAGLAAPFAGFLEVRPEVLQEVSLGALIGRGSMGRAYRGIWQGGRVAVKIIDTWTPGDRPSALSEWDAPTSQAAVVEALLGRSLTHPHIVTVYAHGASQEEVSHNGRVYQQVWIVQEYCNRGSLLDAIDRGVLHVQAGAGGPNLPAIVACALEVAGALCYLHSNDVIHGDLTPSNVLLASATKDTRRFTCKVGDFGLAKYTGGMPEWRSSNFGTVTHMPPELLSDGILSKATDAWSFGVLLLEMWYGRRAWLGVQPISIMAQAAAGQLPFDVPSDAPPELADIMRRCTSLNPSQRPSFQDMLRALGKLSGGLQGATPAEVPTSAAATQLNSRGSGSGGSRRADAARAVAASALPLKTASPFASLPASGTASPFASPLNSGMPSPFAGGVEMAAAAAAPASATPLPFAAGVEAAAAAAATASTPFLYTNGNAAAEPAAATAAPQAAQAAAPAAAAEAKPVLAAALGLPSQAVSPFANGQ